MHPNTFVLVLACMALAAACVIMTASLIILRSALNKKRAEQPPIQDSDSYIRTTHQGFRITHRPPSTYSDMWSILEQYDVECVRGNESVFLFKDDQGKFTAYCLYKNDRLQRTRELSQTSASQIVVMILRFMEGYKDWERPVTAQDLLQRTRTILTNN